MDKSSLRSEFLQRRKNLSEKELEEINEAILKNITLFFKINIIQTVHVFLPQLGKNEIDTWRIISLLRNFPQIKIISPRIIPGTREMEHYLLTPETILINNRWQIPEPDPETSLSVSPNEIDAVLIPLLAFDKRGFRVGYGGGYYDRFLVECRSDVVKIGLSFFEAIDEIDDLDSFDVAMNYCITPFEIVQF
ncbi:5-formyltetrahydrofolate cyclo-ligase [Dyadobacter frigoris]|uniref:5-formyltetrahydrofolate cyclo-ligase n=1 Tax=Dyadobacter frigoris TaxID=2576211 RepID=A0A4U6D3U8_9BACT|nr:5-formyltetrahydrofolate cyclo-ligase [Dyadobacter frigoris]TKT91326.1 5-formyltetrahydrofolate cyclo-ligase [Dyadobacter frigoris]GLU56333.1 5-formyltetrahydrofolate cyclo-ligase [Dyadobacter frigoris]